MLTLQGSFPGGPRGGLGCSAASDQQDIRSPSLTLSAHFCSMTLDLPRSHVTEEDGAPDRVLRPPADTQWEGQT